jgi:hypothetical protein
VQFIVEMYLSRPEDLDLVDARARAAAAELAAEGAPVRHLRSMVMPGDELCLLTYEAPNGELALEACRRAKLVCERVVEAIEAVG